MKMPELPTEEATEEVSLRLRPQPAETVSLTIPEDSFASLRKMAIQRDMSIEALLKWYIG